MVLVPEGKPVSRELNRGLKAPYLPKNMGKGIHIYDRYAHPRTTLEDRLLAVGHWCDGTINGDKVLLVTGSKRIFAWFNARYKTTVLTKAWKDPATRFQLKRLGVQGTGSGIGRPVIPEVAPGVDLDQLEW